MIGVAATAALLLSIGLLCARRVDTAVQLCGLQALCAAIPLWQTTPWIAVLAVALNGIALPLAVTRMSDAPALTVRGNAAVSWAVALVLLVVAIAGLGKVGADGSIALGTTVALFGLLLIVCRRNPLGPAVGLLSSQNGLVLVAGAHPVLSLPAAMVVAVPLIPCLALAERWSRR